MGTAMRFFVVLSGLGFMVFALIAVGPSRRRVQRDRSVRRLLGECRCPTDAGGVAAAPFYVGVRLVRKDVRGGAALVSAS